MPLSRAEKIHPAPNERKSVPGRGDKVAGASDQSGRPGWRDNTGLWLSIVVILLALLLGGSSGAYPIRDMVVQIAGLLAIMLVPVTARPGDVRIGKLAAMFLIGLALLFVVQMLPLPYAVWQDLPGRGLAHDILVLAGAAGEPRPLTLDAERTIASGLSLLPAIGMFLVVIYMSARSRGILAWAIVVCAFASLALGAAQLSAGNGALAISLYASSHVGQPIGFFANSNHQADMLLVGLVLTGTLISGNRRESRGWMRHPLLGYGLIAAFAIGVVLTGSRMAILLLPVAIVAVLLRRSRLKRASGAIIIALLVALFVAGAASGSQIFSTSLVGVSDLGDRRYQAWPDVIYAIQQFSWAGSGMGTFEDVFKTAESLTFVSPNFLNHAHNDYLEVALEAGALGVVLFLIYLVLLVVSARRTFRPSEDEAGSDLAYGAYICILLLMAHSVVDYPLRTALLSTIFGFCWGAVVANNRGERDREPVKSGFT